MKIVSIKRGLAIVLAVLLIFPTRIAIASEDQVPEVAEQQEDHLLEGTEELSDSEKEVLDEDEELDKEDDLDKKESLTEESTGDKGADPEIEDSSEEGVSTEEAKETPIDPDDGDKNHYETETPASNEETDTEEDPSLEGDEEDPVEGELPDIEVEQERVIEKDLKAAAPSVQPLVLEEENRQDIVIGEGSTSVEGFLGNADLVNISIADSVTTIGPGAFNGCPNLTSVNIPDSVTTIGPGAFRDCPSLISINIPGSVTIIENETFYGCSNLTDIDIADGVTTIGASAFSGCSSLTSIDIPNNVATIETRAFSGCSSLTSINIPDSVTSIGSDAFLMCTRLTSIDIPDSVTTIEESVFFGCSNLTSINIPDSVTAIEMRAFSGCSSLANINIPDSVTTIGERAFWRCSSLTNIDIPASVTTIGSGAFAYCSSLTSIDIPGSVKSIGSEAFIDSGLENVVIHGTSTSIGIADGAFHGCLKLKNVKIYGALEIIGQHAFSECGSLEEINIFGSVEMIDSYAFIDCPNLKIVEIPSSVKSVGDYAFGFSNHTDSNTIDNFTIIGIPGSAAEQYAIEFDFIFIDVNTLVDPIITATELPVGVRYAPYEALIENSSTYSWNTVTYSLVDGALPSGIDLDPHSGRLYGVPMGTGTSTFTVRMENSFSRFPDREKTFSITTIDNTDRNVADYTDAGYEITKRVQDMTIDLAYDQTVVSRGSFDEFTTVFIDGVELVRDVDYTAEEGSTRITIMRQTFQRFASIGIHTISIEFRTRDKGLLKRAIQNYEIKATNSGNGSSGDGGHRDRGSNSSDGAPANVIMVIFDPKKGYVHTVTGVIPREWVGYSHWVKDEMGWRLVYADGTEASGYMVEQADGDALEQVLWEMVEGAWYAFGADGYLKSGWVFDHQLSGWYCLSAEGGMHTGWYHDPQDDHDYYLDQTTGRISAGWRQIDGKWYYFKEDTTTPTWKFDKDTGTWAYDPMNINKPYGAMYRREWTPDRYYVDDNGVWDPNVGS